MPDVISKLFAYLKLCRQILLNSNNVQLVADTSQKRALQTMIIGAGTVFGLPESFGRNSSSERQLALSLGAEVVAHGRLDCLPAVAVAVLLQTPPQTTSKQTVGATVVSRSVSVQTRLSRSFSFSEVAVRQLLYGRTVLLYNSSGSCTVAALSLSLSFSYFFSPFPWHFSFLGVFSVGSPLCQHYHGHHRRHCGHLFTPPKPKSSSSSSSSSNTLGNVSVSSLCCSCYLSLLEWKVESGKAHTFEWPINFNPPPHLNGRILCLLLLSFSFIFLLFPFSW